MDLHQFFAWLYNYLPLTGLIGTIETYITLQKGNTFLVGFEFVWGCRIDSIKCTNVLVICTVCSLGRKNIGSCCGTHCTQIGIGGLFTHFYTRLIFLYHITKPKILKM